MPQLELRITPEDAASPLVLVLVDLPTGEALIENPRRIKLLTPGAASTPGIIHATELLPVTLMHVSLVHGASVPAAASAAAAIVPPMMLHANTNRNDYPEKRNYRNQE